ncbi:MAG: phasin family protein [Pseudomonadota bacterium]
MVQVQTVEEIQKLGKDNMDLAMKSFGAWSKSAQAIAIEVADYTKSSFELGTSTLEQLLGAKTVEQALEIQQSYLKTSYEGLVAEATKLGTLYSDLAKEAYKPYQGLFAKTH